MRFSLPCCRMKSGRSSAVILGIAALLFSGVEAHAEPTADYVWIESENTTSINVTPKVSGWGREEFLSEEKWLQVSVDAGKVDKELPPDGALLTYAFKIAKPGSYEIWNRIGYEFARSPFDWRLDDGEWQRIGPDVLTTDLMELQTWNEVAWLKMGTAPLAAGPHKLEIRLPKTFDAKEKPARVLYASDVICIHLGAFYPNSKFKPDEDYRTDQDRQAAKTVFDVPPAPGGGARTEVPLQGLWEICRDDEQTPGETAEPIRDFPQHPYWKSISVPGDKNKLRPDLIFCHRLWYRTRINVPPSQLGRSFFLIFPQNNLNTTVYVNGVFCGFNKNPFARFQIDVTKGIKAGENEVWVGIKDAYYGFSTNPTDPMKLRQKFNYPLEWANKGFMDLAYPIWNHFQSGILVTPEFVCAGPVYAADVFCKPSVAHKELAVDVTLRNPAAQSTAGELLCQAINAKTGAVEKSFSPRPFAIAAGADEVLQLVEPWENPMLWWPNDPNLYRLQTTIRLNGKTADVADTTFGFREWTIDGKDFKLNGVIWHGWADCHTENNKEDWLAFYHQTNQRMMRFWGTSWQSMTPDEALDFFDRSGVVVRRSGLLDGEAIGYWAIEQDPDLKKKYSSDIKMDLMNNWRDQVVAQVKGERNHPSIMIWSIENEWLYINCINLYRRLMDQFEAEETKVSDAVRAADPTRPTMSDGGCATVAQTLPVHGNHYVAGKPMDYPDLAYEANPTGGGRDRWVWDEKRPRFIGEDFFMTGNHPEVAYFEGDSAFAGKPKRGVAIWERILEEGYRWAGYGAWQFWLGQTDTDGSQYNSFAPRAVFCRQWDWTFNSGEKVKRTFGIFNDTRFDDPITFTWTLTVAGKSASHTQEYTIPAGTNRKFDEIIPLPAVDRRTEGELVLSLSVQGKEVFRDTKAVSILNPTALHTRPEGSRQGGGGVLAVFDPHGQVTAFLKSRGIPFTAVESLNKLPAARVLIIGKDALDARECTSSRLAAYAAEDHRIIVLEQTHPLHYQGLPADMEAATNEGRTAFAEDLEHPVLHGLTQKDFFTWGPDEIVYRNACLKPTRGAKSLIQCDDRLRCTALAEVPVGKGIMLLSQLVIGEKLADNPVAQQLLLNMLGYAETYQQVFYQVAAAVADAPQLHKALDTMGLEYTAVAGPLEALDAGKAKIAIVSASPANLKLLAANMKKVDKFAAAGGSLVLCGLTPEGLADYNRIVGVDHMIRPGKRERVTFPTVRDPLTAGLTSGDIVLDSGKRIFSWTAGDYVVSDMFSYVIDYDEVASFGKSPFFAYDNITNGFVSADGWPLIINFPKNQDDTPYDVPITLQRPQTLTEFTWVGNTFYWPQTKVNLIFDGDKAHPLSFDTQPNNEPQTFAIDPPRTAKEVTVEIAGWTPVADKAPNLGIDNIYFKAQRPAAFYQTVQQMLNVGGLMHYHKGASNIVLCNLLFKEQEEVAENAVKKRAILATILRNLKAPFAGGKMVIAGAALQYQPVDISKQATQYRDDRGWFGDRKFTFKDMPTGDQRFAGVPFHVYDFPTSPVPTVIMLEGPRIPNQLPTEVRGIPVNQTADALFFLQAARIDARRNPREIKNNKQYELCRYVVHYADGETAEIPIYTETDIDNYRQREPAAVAGAQIAWTRPYDGTEFSAVAYMKQWNNPRPGVAIRSIAMLPGDRKHGVVALLALTAARAEE